MAFWYTIMNIFLSPIWSVLQQRTIYPTYNGGLVGLIFAIAVGFWIMQACITYAMRFIPGSLAGVLIYVAVPIAYILDVALVGTQPGYLEIIGVCVIVVTNMLIGIVEYCACCPSKAKVDEPVDDELTELLS